MAGVVGLERLPMEPPAKGFQVLALVDCEAMGVLRVLVASVIEGKESDLVKFHGTEGWMSVELAARVAAFVADQK